MKKILILSDVNSSHTQKWCTSLAEAGFTIGIFSLSKVQNEWYKNHVNILVFNSVSFSSDTFHSSIFPKIKYLMVLPGLKKIIKSFQPDILHSHYATSYGLLGALSGFHPFLISAWGSDLMNFPYSGWLNRMMIKFNFEKADVISVTSQALAFHAKKFTRKEVHIIPFGVDLDKFKPDMDAKLFKKKEIVIGAVKSLEKIYGIDVLIKTVALLLREYPEPDIKLLIVGDGSCKAEYENLVRDLKIEKNTEFVGKIAHAELINYYHRIDIFVNVSKNESFGVSVIEASACGLPVIVSRVGGLVEVVVENKTGFFIEPEDEQALLKFLKKLIQDFELKNQMGKSGRQFVEHNYNWNQCLTDQIKLYNNVLTK